MAQFLTINAVPVERWSRKKNKISVRWGNGWAIQWTADGKQFRDAIQPYFAGKGAKQAAIEQGKILAKEMGIPFRRPD